MVEAGGQHIRGFRCGLDYAFIHDALCSKRPDAERVIQSIYRLDPSARPWDHSRGESMSLYRAGLKLALFLPLGVAMPLSFEERRQVSPM